MKLPMFFQKSLYSFQVTGLPAIGRKFSFQECMIEFQVERSLFKITLTPSESSLIPDLENWERSIEEKIESFPKRKTISDTNVFLEYPDRIGMDSLISFILDRNGGISHNSAIPDSFTWNSEGFPILMKCKKNEMRFSFHTSEGRWYMSFAPTEENRTLDKKYPEDYEKIKLICKKKGIELHSVSYLPYLYELSKEDWNKLTESLLL